MSGPIKTRPPAGQSGSATYIWDDDEEEYVLAAQPPRAFVGPTDPSEAGFTMRDADIWDATS